MKVGKNVQIFLVGGAVRDQLLGIPSHDKDWVVVGGSPESMLEQGFRSVGQDFPVFLHAKTQEEYALARTERKTGQGYNGFECFYAPDVTLDEDLARRDLTINAIAQSKDGTLHDPYHGQKDRKEVGIKLKVTPQINEGDSIQMQIEQEVSNVLGPNGAVDVRFAKRQINTSVMVQDGQMIVLGGLIDDQ